MNEFVRTVMRIVLAIIVRPQVCVYKGYIGNAEALTPPRSDT